MVTTSQHGFVIVDARVHAARVYAADEPLAKDQVSKWPTGEAFNNFKYISGAITLYTLPSMTKTISRKLEMANKFARTLGFSGGLSDKNEIGKDELCNALASVRALHPEIVELFKSCVQGKRLRKGIFEHSDAIRLLRCVLRDPAVNLAVYTRKLNNWVNGKQKAVFRYTLLGR